MISPPDCSIREDESCFQDYEPDWEILCDDVVCYGKDESGNVRAYTVEDLKREDEEIIRLIRDSAGTDRWLRSLNRQKQFISCAFIKPSDPDRDYDDWRPRTREEKKIAKKFRRKRERQFKMTQRGEKSAEVRGYEDRSFVRVGAAA